MAWFRVIDALQAMSSERRPTRKAHIDAAPRRGDWTFLAPTPDTAALTKGNGVAGIAGSGDEPTVVLIERIRAGDDRARDVLFRRYLPVLRRWAHGRLPAHARDTNDTDDLVQVALVRALHRTSEFDAQESGSFLAYLRQILLNQIRDEL